MAKITFISVGTLKEQYLRDGIEEYKKRLLQYAKVEEVVLKEERIQNEDDESQIKKALLLEGERILSALPKDSYKIAMCVEGREYDSVALADLVSRAVNEKGHIVFIIGSSHGLSDEVKRAADARLSISKLTFPHQLMRVILAESVYRSFTIINGKKYHK